MHRKYPRTLQHDRIKDHNYTNAASKRYNEKRVSLNEERIAMIGVPYREAIGALMYLSVRTRPDISILVCILAKHVQGSRKVHWEAVNRIMRYLKGTKEEGLILHKTLNKNDIKASLFADADLGTDPDDRHSRTGVVCQLGRSTIWWKLENKLL